MLVRMHWGLALVIVCGCGSMRSGGDDDDGVTTDARGTGSGSSAVSVFDTTITKVVVEIDYETNQQPFTGPIVGFGDTFEPTQANIDRLFAGNKALTIPRTLDVMQDVGAIADEELTVDDIFALADQHRNVHSSDGSRSYYVIFVSGHFADGNGVQAGVLGVSIGDTIAMFKDVINSTNVPLAPNVVRYVEQSTLIHELAHSIGLVDNGVHMLAAHKDAPHGAHCTNQDCVMFWQNEGSNDAARFAQQKLLTGSSILFDAQCLADVDALTGGP
jgi:hypothetical protein